MVDTHQPPFDPDVTYEAEFINLWTDDEAHQIGLAISTPNGQRVMIGVTDAQLSVLLMQIRDAREALSGLRDWQPFHPA